jgi:capsular polysaccharide transport system permease protein
MAYSETDFNPAPLMVGLRRYRAVMSALLLRDIKSRYFGSAWGYLISLGWPLAHIAILMAINSILGRMHPYGDSTLLWYASGITPYMVFSYTARFIALGFLMNSPLLSFPEVKTLDILFARVAVEILSSGLVFIVVYLCLAYAGVDFMPVDPAMAFTATSICILNGIGLGIIMALLAKLSLVWNVIGILILIVLWGISGVLFVPSFTFETIRDILVYNPVMHAVSMYRAAYYEGYAADWLDVEYSVKFGLALLAIALVLERILRGRLRE